MNDFSKLFQKNSKDKNTSLLRVFGKTELVVNAGFISYSYHISIPTLDAILSLKM